MAQRNLRLSLTAVVLGAVSLALGTVGAPNQVPSVVERFLADNPSLHLLRLADVRDIVEPPVEFSPFVEADLTGDGVEDVAAVVVQSGSPTRYGVVAFNGSRNGFGPGQWIVHLRCSSRSSGRRVSAGTGWRPS